MAESGWFVNEGRFERAKRRVFIRPVAVVALGRMLASCAPMPRQLAQVREHEAQALRSAAEVQPVEVIAGLSEPLRAVIPDGAVFGSPELDAKFSTDGYSSRVYLIDGADSLVLMTVFQ
ncbi:hypothetical protein G7066_14245 [Leucobacter coleopterorum]|uniref:Uncharacterized protein n=1 Tax=Leucobacter coleopterorum TaxID=2714933 RepID=A0ABX6JYY0_9MICO|nr:hypothetical protein [Leucobacter coleopterorum]QIM19442.1 hypothetical protein G7066_14245 [Leucobacter coleopterorum]